jgi:signal transduction histidine kinase
MGLRPRSIRQKILLLVLVPVVSLIGLYVFATSITARNAINLARTDTLKNATGVPIGAFLATMDGERPLALVYLSRPTGANLAALQAAEARTNGAVTAMRAALRSPGTTGNASAAEKQAIATLVSDTASLPGLRSQVRSQVITRSQAFSDYNKIVDDGYQAINRVIRQETNSAVVANSLAFIRMGKSQEMLLREDALVRADLAAGTYPASDRLAVTELVGARKTLAAQTLPDLDPQYRAIYTRDVSPQASAALSALEGRLISDTATARPPAVPPAEWARAVGAVATGFSKAGTQASNELTARSHRQAQSTYLTLLLIGGLGLLAVALAIVISVWVGRGLVRELAALRRSALDLAHQRLPDVVHRLAAGQQVDVAAETPELPAASTQEIAQVGEAFTAVQQTAVEAAVGQARLRQGISDIFRNLARRSQSLLHRQLTLLDAMERRAKEPEELEDLFRIDHLTTRMRRHAESLIILSGDAPARGWRRPVAFVDVLRAAVAEVEDYTRIKVTAPTNAAVAGPAVADVIHMIAELAENAVVFSPPNTPVLVTGDIVGRGFAVEIEDRGLGLSEERRAELNQMLENPPPFDLSGSDQLGLFVASQLATKHGIRISLRSSPYGGTTAIVLIPLSLVITEDSYPDGEDTETDPATAPLTGRHAAREDAASFGEPISRPAAPAPAGAEPPVSRWAEDSGTDVWAPASTSGTGPASTGGTGPASTGGAGPAGLAAGLWAEDATPSGAWTASSGMGTPAEPASPLNGFGTISDDPAWIRPAEPAASDDADPGSRDDDADPDEAGLLPRRVRQASLAPQLRDDPGPAKPAAVSDLAAEAADDRSPEEARSTVASLQRGWERGRSLFEAPPAAATTTVTSAEAAEEAAGAEPTPGSQPSDE